MSTKVYKRIKVNPDDYQVVTGKTKYDFEIPFAEDLDLWVEWKADGDTIVSLVFTDGKQMPYANGLDGHFAVQTRSLLSVVFQCTAKTNVAVCIWYKDLAVKEKLRYQAVNLAVPPAAQIDLSSMLSAEVQKQLARQGIVPQKFEVSEEDNLEIDEPEEFGEGYMEDEEPPLPLSKPAKKRNAPVSTSADVGTGSVGDSDPGDVPSSPPGKP